MSVNRLVCYTTLTELMQVTNLALNYVLMCMKNDNPVDITIFRDYCSNIDKLYKRIDKELMRDCVSEVS